MSKVRISGCREKGNVEIHDVYLEPIESVKVNTNTREPLMSFLCDVDYEFSVYYLFLPVSYTGLFVIRRLVDGLYLDWIHAHACSTMRFGVMPSSTEYDKA